jgi:copper resistance protein B
MLTLLVSVSAFATTVPATAQSMSGMDMKGMSMPGMKMPAASSKKGAPSRPAKKRMAGKAHRSRPAYRSKPAMRRAPASHGMSMSMPGMDHGSMAGMDMSGSAAKGSEGAASMPDMQMPGMAMSGMAPAPMVGTALTAGNAPAPSAPTDHYADQQFPVSAMDRARHQMMAEQGGQAFYKVLLNLAEFQAHQGRNGYRWDGEAWLGDDINRLTIKSEGEGTLHEGVDSAEVQALYSRAVGPYFNLQAGVRHDFQPSPTRTYATIGFEGLSPLEFETEGALFLSNKGDLLARLEGWYDERVTQRLVLQPRVELNFAAQDVREDRLGAGVTDAELGLRLRYEIRREFAPYVGVSWDRKTGATARFARGDGQRASSTSLVLGIRTWF